MGDNVDTQIFAGAVRVGVINAQLPIYIRYPLKNAGGVLFGRRVIVAAIDIGLNLAV